MLKRKIVIVFSLFAIYSATFAQQEEDLIARGLECLKKMQLVKAEELFLKVLEKNPKNKMAHYYLGEVYYKQGKWVQAGKAYHKAAKLDRKFKEAWNAYGKALLKQDWLSDNNLQAQWQFEKALAIDRDYLEARINLAKAYGEAWKGDMAISELEKLVKEGKENAEIHFLLGKYFEDRASIILTKRIERAVDSYKRALQLNPTYGEAWFRLGVNHYKIGNLNTAKNCFKKALQYGGDLQNSRLFLGIIAHEQKQYRKAMEYFHQAISHMEEKERRLYQDLEIFLSSKEKEEFKKLSDTEKENYIRKFWIKRDPDPTTELNERQIEHYYRIAYSRLFFSKGQYPWDQRGEVFIRWGRPDSRFLLGGINVFNEQWIYYDLNYPILFYDKDWAANFQIKPIPQKWQENPVVVHAGMTLKYPDYYAHTYDGSPLKYIFDLANFKGENNKTTVEIYYGIPLSELDFTKIGKRREATVVVRMAFFDKNMDLVTKTEKRTKYFFDDPRVNTFSNLIFDTEKFALSAGEYLFTICIKDQKSKNIEIYNKQVKIEDFSKKRLALSDLKWSDTVVFPSGEIEFSEDELKMRPYPIRIYSPGQKLYLYFEIYNLKADSVDNTHYRVEYFLRPYRKREALTSIVNVLKDIITFGKGGQQTPITVSSFDYRGQKTDDWQFISLDVSAYPAATYELGVKVTDLNSGQAAQRSSICKISEKFPKLLGKRELAELGFDFIDRGMVASSLTAPEKFRGLPQEFEVGSPIESVAYLDLGSKYQRQGKIDKAIRLYQLALELKDLHPGIRPEIYNNLGIIFFQKKDYKRAEKEFKRALEIKKDYEKARFNLGLLYLIRGQYKEAIEEYEKLKSFYPERGEVLSNLGYAYYLMAKQRIRTGVPRQWDYGKAKNLLRQAIKVNPNYALSHERLGIIFWDEDKIEEAKGEFLKALELDANRALSHFYLGQIFQKQKNHKEAEIHFALAAGLDSNNPVLYTELGNYYFQAKNYEMAQEIMVNALQLDPNSAEARFRLGNIYYRMGKKEDAISEWKRCGELDPEYLAQIYNNLGVLYMDLEQWDKAVQYYKQALEIQPEFAVAHNNLGEAYRRKGWNIHAMKEYTAAVKLDPLFAAAYNNLGEMRYAQGKFSLAENSFREAIRLDSDYASAYNNLGVVLLDKGEIEQSYLQFKKALQLNPDYSEAYCNLGTVLMRMDSLKSAILSFRKALKLNPEYPNALKQISYAYIHIGDFDRVIGKMEICKKLTPNDPEVYYILGLTFQQDRKYNLAIENYKQAINLDKKYPDPYFQLGEVYEKLKQVNQAEDSYKKFIKLAKSKGYRDRVDMTKRKLTELKKKNKKK